MAKRRHAAQHARIATLALAVGSVVGTSGVLAARGVAATNTAAGTTGTSSQSSQSSGATSPTSATSDDNAAVPATNASSASSASTAVTTTHGS